MTKRLHMSVPSGEPPKRKGPGALRLALAIFMACAVGVGFAMSGVDSTPATQLSLRFSQILPQGITEAPQVLPSLRLGGWPTGLIGQPEGTKLKPATMPEAVPMLPAIAIVIDDLGIDEARTRTAMALPAAVTLAFLPYAGASSSLSHQAYVNGHEIIVHLPMEPRGAQNPGPMPLTDGLSAAEITQRLDWALSRVSDYDGANNHMGSRFTASREALLPVMQELSARKLFFLDSRTTADTQAEKLARETGLLTGARDIFLDNDETAPPSSANLRVSRNKPAPVAAPSPSVILMQRRWRRWKHGRKLWEREASVWWRLRHCSSCVAERVKTRDAFEIDARALNITVRGRPQMRSEPLRRLPPSRLWPC